MKNAVLVLAWLTGLGGFTLLGVPIAQAQIAPITPAADGTGTTVTLQGNRFDIGGGRSSSDGANLFQSFDRFGLNQGEVANFLASPTVRNILGRVVGGDPSVINGLLQVTGSAASLYLLNPAGIVFGANASLNVPASFTATTATGIGFRNGQWFNAIGAADYATLIGTPNAFAFKSLQPGAIANLGNLAVSQGQSLTLLGGTVLNTGQLTAPGGQITIAAVPDQTLVRLSQPGSLLSLEFSPLSVHPSFPNAAPPTLPQLLTGGGLGNATGLTANSDGTIQLTGATTRLSTAPGSAIVSGQVSVASSAPPASPASLAQIAVLGDRVSLQAATLDASGLNGGTVRIGGGYQGQGTVPNARFTDVNAGTVVRADAIAPVGNGGTIIVWSNDTTNVAGTITAKGGTNGGNGGFVETSGKQTLEFTRARVNASAPNGQPGTWLLDPSDITIDPMTAALLSSTLNDGVSLNLTTVGGTGGNGDILLQSSINKTNNNLASLTLTASRYITPAGGATINLASGNLTLNVNQEGLAATTNPTIQNAIAAIGTVATVPTINLGAGTYTLANTVNITRSLALNGVSASNTIVSGNNAVRVFNISGSGTSVTIGGLTIANGNQTGDPLGGGGLLNNTGSTLTLNNSVVRNNSSAAGGGGIRNDGIMVLNNVTVSNNIATNAFGGGIDNVFGGTLTLNNSAVIGNQANLNGGGIDNYSDATVPAATTVTLNNSIVTNNSASGSGGGIYYNSANANSAVTLNNTTISNNTAGNVGGGIAHDSTGSLTVTNSIFSGNLAQLGGGIFNSSSNLTIANSTFEGNRALGANGSNGSLLGAGGGGGGGAGLGGALYNDAGIVVIRNSTFLSNKATGGNGGQGFPNNGSFNGVGGSGGGPTGGIGATPGISGGSGGFASGGGGGGGSAFVGGAGGVGGFGGGGGGGGGRTAGFSGLPGGISQFGGGTGGQGGASAAAGGGGGAGLGGAVFANAGIVNLTDTTFSGNSSTGGTGGNSGFTAPGSNGQGMGGAIFTNAGATVNLNNATLSSNSATDRGGGIFNNAGIDNFINSTLSANTAGAGGGGIYNDSGTVNVTNSTLSGNMAQGGLGGGGIANYGLMFIGNSIVAGNTSPSRPDVGGTFNSQGYNLIGNPSGGSGFVSTDLLNVDPKLAPLGNYGGATQTLALLAGSPAIDAGSNTLAVDANGNPLTTDQRGASRIANIRVDIGAYEFGSSFPQPTPQSTPQPTPLSSPQPTPQLTPPDPERRAVQQESTPVYPKPPKPVAEAGQIARIDRVNTLQTELESSITEQFASHLELKEQPAPQSLPQIQDALQKIETAAGVKPALFYISLLPRLVKADISESDSDNKEPKLSYDAAGNPVISQVSSAEPDLVLVVVPATGSPILRKVPGVTRSKVLKLALTFRNEVADPSKTLTRSYLPSAEKLYSWLIKPIEPELKAQGIDTLMFIMDTNLRFLPLAALYDERDRKFLVEKYSIGLLPSLSLTDLRYGNVRNAQVLAAGASTFTDDNLDPLLGVKLELSTILKGDRWQGRAILNGDFTATKLQKERQGQPFGIIHLATHGAFLPGNINKSYIQLADAKLRLDQIRTLGWNKPAAELVVLSACQMALGDEDAELGFAGFAVKAGVKSALASLWNISDEGTIGLMSRFYEELRQLPTKAGALREAQIAMLKGQVRVEDGKLQYGANQEVLLPPELAKLSQQTFSHPYYWSAFTMIGSPW